MTIPFFAENQNDVFVPALFAVLAATVLICLPIVFVQGLSRSGRRVPVTAVAWVLGALALGVAGWQATIGFTTLGDQRTQVRSEISTRYGLDLSAGDVASLIEGGGPKRVFLAQATAAGLASPDIPHTLRLVADPVGSNDYVLDVGGKPVPVTNG